MSLSAYAAKTWIDYADSPDLSAANIQAMDTGIQLVTAEVIALEAALPTTYQPLSAELTALVNASTAGGYAKRLGAGSWGIVTSIPQSDVSGLTAALAGLQPLDSDLTAIAALSTQAYGRSLLTAADAAAAQTLLGVQAAGSYALWTSGSNTLASMDLSFAPRQMTGYSIGGNDSAGAGTNRGSVLSMQGYDTNFQNQIQVSANRMWWRSNLTSGSWTGATWIQALDTATAAATYQPLDSDLTAIAALSTQAYGRSLLTTADAAAARSTIGLGALATKAQAAWTADISGLPTGLSQIGQPTTFGNILIGSSAVNAWHGIAFSDPQARHFLVNKSTGSDLSGVYSATEGWIWSFAANGALSSGTVPAGKVTGTLADTQIASASTWNAASAASHTHANMARLGVINQDLATNSAVAFASASIGAGAVASWAGNGAYAHFFSTSYGNQSGSAWAGLLASNTGHVWLGCATGQFVKLSYAGTDKLIVDSAGISLAVRPTFAGATPWDSGNLSASSTVAALGSSTPGVAATFSRGDHVHAMPTAAQVGALPISGGTVTGTLNCAGIYSSNGGAVTATGAASFSVITDSSVATLAVNSAEVIIKSDGFELNRRNGSNILTYNRFEDSDNIVKIFEVLQISQSAYLRESAKTYSAGGSTFATAVNLTTNVCSVQTGPSTICYKLPDPAACSGMSVSIICSDSAYSITIYATAGTIRGKASGSYVPYSTGVAGIASSIWVCDGASWTQIA